MDNTDFLTDVTISKVFQGKSGEGQYGPWTAWNFYVDGDDRKFSYFSGGKKQPPAIGMRLKMLRFETVEKGGYMNNNVKEMFPAKEAQKPPQTRPDAPQSTISTKDASFYVSYAKDAGIAHMTVFPDAWKGVSLDQFCEIIVLNGKRMMKMVNGEPPPRKFGEAQYKGEPDDSPEPIDTFTDGTPIGEEPEWVKANYE